MVDCCGFDSCRNRVSTRAGCGTGERTTISLPRHTSIVPMHTALLFRPSRGVWSLDGDIFPGQEVGCPVGRPGNQTGFQQTNRSFFSSHLHRHPVGTHKQEDIHLSEETSKMFELVAMRATCTLLSEARPPSVSLEMAQTTSR